MNKQKIKAFTLAEVLVTLMIIGVISALTIPTLKESADRSANRAALQKAYATASNAFASLKAEYGQPIYWTVPSDTPNAEGYLGARVFREATDKPFSWFLQKKINVAKSSGIPPNGYMIKTLSGSNFISGGNGEINGTTVHFGNIYGPVSFQSADNMYWFPSHTYSGCQHEITAADGSTVYVCGYIVVDTNGAKEPNRMGVDVFVFEETIDGIIPHVGADDCKDMTGNGYTCSAKLINGGEHALDFIYE